MGIEWGMVDGDGYGIEDFGLRCQIGSTFWLTHTHTVYPAYTDIPVRPKYKYKS